MLPVCHSLLAPRALSLNYLNRPLWVESTQRINPSISLRVSSLIQSSYYSLLCDLGPRNWWHLHGLSEPLARSTCATQWTSLSSKPPLHACQYLGGLICNPVFLGSVAHVVKKTFQWALILWCILCSNCRPNLLHISTGFRWHLLAFVFQGLYTIICLTSMITLSPLSAAVLQFDSVDWDLVALSFFLDVYRNTIDVLNAFWQAASTRLPETTADNER